MPQPRAHTDSLASLLLMLLFQSHFPCLPLHAELKVPSSTAYAAPHHNTPEFKENVGITRWSNPDTRFVWYGNLVSTGKLSCSLELDPNSNLTGSVQLSVNNEPHRVALNSTSASSTNILNFGEFDITQPGFHRFELSLIGPVSGSGLSVSALSLSGPASEKAHFNLKPRRNAASVHLAYPVSTNQQVAGFYCEITAQEDPVHTYYMACGWHRGYFGMQVNSATERRIIFSVWDSGNEAVDRQKVQTQDRVTLIAKGDKVFSGDFGNEGTGGHSHLKYLWKTPQTQKFFVSATPVDATHTVYSGFYFHPDRNTWMLISSWKAPKEGGYMRGLYSFSENFWGSTGHLRRKALFGNQWIKSSDGTWAELTTATFSHDPTGKSDRIDRFMGLEGDGFFLSHGGYVEGFTKYGTPFTRPPHPERRPLLELPPLPDLQPVNATTPTTPPR